tara:strand:+ start:518 stop:790 length:273 start_codon:yes stop_codon:yes gene_type:complete
MLFMDIPSNKVNPVNSADNRVKVRSNANNLGSLHLLRNQRITGVMMKYKKIENTNGTNMVFIEYNANVMPMALRVIKLAGMMLSRSGVIL